MDQTLEINLGLPPTIVSLVMLDNAFRALADVIF